MTGIQDETQGWQVPVVTALLVLADGTVIEGYGLGATGQAVGEVCFNTAMTGYEEILTDPSYAGQIVTFTFPHIGNVGTNDEDVETVNLAANYAAWSTVPANQTGSTASLAATGNTNENHRATIGFDRSPRHDSAAQMSNRPVAAGVDVVLANEAPGSFFTA